MEEIDVLKINDDDDDDDIFSKTSSHVIPAITMEG